MMNIRNILTSLVLLAAMFTRVDSASAGGNGIDPAIIDRFIVRLVPDGKIGVFLDLFEATHAQAGITTTVLDAIPNYDMYFVGLTIPPTATPQQIAAIEPDLFNNASYNPYRLWAEVLYQNEAPEGKTGTIWVDGAVSFTDYSGQYAVERIGLQAALQRSTGRGITVAVLDTGIDASHPALVGRIAPGGFNFVDDTLDTGDVAANADADGDGLLDEMTGHGTFVAGIIALAAPEARILPVRVLNSDGVGNMWWLTKGLFHAIDRGVEVINLSLSSTYNSQAVEDAIDVAEHLGIVVVAAAGNFNRSKPREYPAMGSGVLGVAALDADDAKGDFSNYNDRLFISAPGASDLTPRGQVNAARSIISALPGGNFESWEGTSMAAPFVSGTVALIRAQHPEWPGALPPESIIDRIEDILENSADDIYDTNPQYDDEELGVGRVNAHKAVLLGPVMPAVGDLNNDGTVGLADLQRVIAEWSLVHTSADIDGNGSVGIGDLLAVLGNWG